jgi:hypothetical protein
MFTHVIFDFNVDQIYFTTYQIMIYNKWLNCIILMFILFFVCDSLIFIKHYDQNAS